eukprot:7680434-Prorocentrum_lima.AAC.1
MTSSLVGSEMCIRDRSSTTWYVSHATFSVAVYGTWPVADLAAAAWYAAVTVSYTHLTLPTICSV